MTMFILFFTIMLLFVGQQRYLTDVELDREINPYWSVDIFEWNSSIMENNIVNESQLEYRELGRFTNMVYKFGDFARYSLFEFAKFSIEAGYTHPEYDYNTFMTLIKWMIIITIFMIFAPLIIPLFILIYIMVDGIINLIKKRKIKNKNG